MSETPQDIEVIVPVHGGAPDLERCLASLARTLLAGATVQIIDDASHDAGVDALLAAYPGQSKVPVRIVAQAANLGFVRTVNAAMARSRADVVLLNSDTIVTTGWLERIARCAASDPLIATITPFSNNAEICSLPVFCAPNPVPEDPDVTALACMRAGAPQYPELPTGVGFCMYVRRAALEALGDFDDATFGHGYGEENDFCMRAAAHGWRNVLADDAYVAHRGGASFAALGLKPGGTNLARLAARYPGYNRAVADFIARDPLAARRSRIAATLT